ncbi:hypothetical protein E1263_35955 [Kribbella antibiotica]|uniref:Uncharacterized protein n=1 Tax=Kribbella antibiotica TaxID=190195 RepID=A0A4R4YQ84_9ACTN|nr:hypothetical protein [Kribbella antibiotica]TDD46760.1 hypothetical protein E1263_35955 [Kribbella antibiotica]
MSERKDQAAADKAAELYRAQSQVVPRLEATGHLKAAKNIEAKGGRWDSPEAKNEGKKGWGRG